MLTSASPRVDGHDDAGERRGEERDRDDREEGRQEVAPQSEAFQQHALLRAGDVLAIAVLLAGIACGRRLRTVVVRPS